MSIAVIVRNCVRFHAFLINFPFQLNYLINFIETPKGTNEYCPRKNGIFSHPDETICNIFYTCVDGEYIENKCPPGLHYDELSATCVWPDTANRENCQENKMKLKDGFVCPSDRNRTDKTGQVVAHPHYAHPTDCQR